MLEMKMILRLRRDYQQCLESHA